MNIGNKLIHMGINRQVYLLPLFTWYNEKIKINRTYCWHIIGRIYTDLGQVYIPKTFPLTPKSKARVEDTFSRHHLSPLL